MSSKYFLRGFLPALMMMTLATLQSAVAATAQEENTFPRGVSSFNFLTALEDVDTVISGESLESIMIDDEGDIPTKILITDITEGTLNPAISGLYFQGNKVEVGDEINWDELDNLVFRPSPNWNNNYYNSLYTFFWKGYDEGYGEEAIRTLMAVRPVPDLPLTKPDQIAVEASPGTFVVDVLDNDFAVDISYYYSSTYFYGSLELSETGITKLAGDTGAVVTVDPTLQGDNFGPGFVSTFQDVYQTDLAPTVGHTTRGVVEVTPSAEFTGVMSFDYEVCEVPDDVSEAMPIDCGTETVVVEVANVAPTVQSDSLEIMGSSYAFSQQEFSRLFADDNDDDLKTLRVEAPLPSAGQVLLGETPVEVGQVIPAAELDSLRYELNTSQSAPSGLQTFNESPSFVDTFSFVLGDGAQYSPVATITFQGPAQIPPQDPVMDTPEPDLDTDAGRGSEIPPAPANNPGLIRTGGFEN